MRGSALIVLASVAAVATSTGAAARPTVGDSSGKIAFSERFIAPHDAYHIVLIDPGGGRPRVLPVGPRHSYSPTWAPDAARIAFVSDDFSGGRPEVWVMDANGSKQRRLARKGDEPAWSPDGRRIAFSRGGDLYLVGAGGRGEHRLLRNGTAPTWSPDGKIAFVRAVAPRCSGAARDRERCRRSFEIYVTNTDGTLLRRLTRNRRHEYSPDWSPTGTRIAFDRGASVFVMDADGGNQHRLASNGFHPSWSPDAARIAYFGYNAIWTMGADGSDKQVLYPPRWSCPECGPPAWSDR